MNANKVIPENLVAVRWPLRIIPYRPALRSRSARRPRVFNLQVISNFRNAFWNNINSSLFFVHMTMENGAFVGIY